MEEFSGRLVGIRHYFVQGSLEAQVIRLAAEGISFLPGQYLMLSEEGFRLRADPGQLKWTPYSIASSPLENGMLEFVYTIKQTGGFTQHLAEKLQVGSVLGMKGPFGKFILDENGRQKIFVATGAGIAPIMSMIRTLARQGRGQMALFYGFRTGEHFLYREELEALAGAGKLRLLTAASRDPFWKSERGHVQKLLEKESFDPAKQEAYICGNPEMVREVRKLFAEKGFAKEQVRVEQW